MNSIDYFCVNKNKGNTHLEKQIESLNVLVESIQQTKDIHEKLSILNGQLNVRVFFEEFPSVQQCLEALSKEEEFIFKAVIAIGQAERVFLPFSANEEYIFLVKNMLKNLLTIEIFYAEIGGIIGYHLKMLQFLCLKDRENQEEEIYLPPAAIDISKQTRYVKEAIFWGIQKMGDIAEIYPVGGAADRLKLQDEKKGQALPAAKLVFCGKTLLERLIIDLQAREYLHYKLNRVQLKTPVAMMTSMEKDNHAQILSILEHKSWFGRDKESFRLFCQPLVPTMNEEGKWCLHGPMQILLKPGGHGVIWKLARDEGIFDWLFAQGRSKALIRQINNPVAGCDYSLFSFTGIGCKEDKHFGFASCQRLVKANEGVNVLVQRKKSTGYEYLLSNIEYCHFSKFGLVDEPAETDPKFSKFSSNTNILFVDLQAIYKAISLLPIPGMLINFKKTTYRNEKAILIEEKIGRLESTMQNIAEYFTERFQEPLPKENKQLEKVFVTFNKRSKTISTPKREYVLGSSLLETPEGCFLDVLENVRELLVDYCKMKVPKLNDLSTFFSRGPSFICFYHPALGPLYSIIAQKIKRGTLAEGSELQLEIAELFLEDLDLCGTLVIKAECIMGYYDQNGFLHYSSVDNGKCMLKNVKVRNQGIDREAANVFWRHDSVRKEECRIHLHGNAEFYAENVILEGNVHINVENGFRMTATQEGTEVHFRKEKITAPSWKWDYSWKEDFEVELKIAGKKARFNETEVKL